MKIIEYPVEIRLSYPLERLGDPSGLLFFDIETTGFSAYSSSLYLIGALYLKDGQFYLRQWFSESLSDELSLLRDFFAFAAGFQALVHFNGDGFDLRYIRDAAKQYGIASTLDKLESFDILKNLRRTKKVLGLDSLKQKSVENFLGIYREDRYSGGELISVYESYLKNGEEELLSLLLLHNAEDVKGMPEILPSLLYGDALKEPGTLKASEKENGALTLRFEYPEDFPVPLLYRENSLILSFQEHTLKLTVPLYSGTLRYYYPDYKNYYYLPQEGTAIHKKLAQFVDKAYREPATPENCFTAVSGLFVDEVKDSGLRIFKKAPKDAHGYHLVSQEEDFDTRYPNAVFRRLMK